LQGTPLLIGIELSQRLDSLGFLDLKILQLFPVVHRLLDSLVDSHKLLVVLHFLQLGLRLDLRCLNCAIQLLVQLLHLFLMVKLELLDFLERLLFLHLKFALPGNVEVLELIIADVNILFHLLLLDACSHLILIVHNFSFKQSHFSHQVFVQLILMNFLALGGKQLHLLLDNGENQNLFVLVQRTVHAAVKHLDEFNGRLQAQQIENLGLALFEDQLDVCFVQNAFISEICLPDGVPNFLALASTSEHRSGLINQLLALVSGNVGERGESLGVSVATRVSHARCLNMDVGVPRFLQITVPLRCNLLHTFIFIKRFRYN